ncbi:MAG: hypothetical protein Q8L29_02255 [archaeon]|nr:hypothetical protein [archaeon]
MKLDKKILKKGAFIGILFLLFIAFNVIGEGGKYSDLSYITFVNLLIIFIVIMLVISIGYYFLVKPVLSSRLLLGINHPKTTFSIIGLVLGFPIQILFILGAIAWGGGGSTIFDMISMPPSLFHRLIALILYPFPESFSSVIFSFATMITFLLFYPIFFSIIGYLIGKSIEKKKSSLGKKKSSLGKK